MDKYQDFGHLSRYNIMIEGICRWKFRVEFLYIYWTLPGAVTKNAIIGPQAGLEPAALYLQLYLFLRDIHFFKITMTFFPNFPQRTRSHSLVVELTETKFSLSVVHESVFIVVRLTSFSFVAMQDTFSLWCYLVGCYDVFCQHYIWNSIK